MKYIEKIALWLTVIGGLNWGLVGAFDLDLVALLFGPLSLLSRIVYILVGISALWVAYAEIIHEKNEMQK